MEHIKMDRVILALSFIIGISSSGLGQWCHHKYPNYGISAYVEIDNDTIYNIYQEDAIGNGVGTDEYLRKVSLDGTILAELPLSEVVGEEGSAFSTMIIDGDVIEIRTNASVSRGISETYPIITRLSKHDFSLIKQRRLPIEYTSYFEPAFFRDDRNGNIIYFENIKEEQEGRSSQSLSFQVWKNGNLINESIHQEPTIYDTSVPFNFSVTPASFGYLATCSQVSDTNFIVIDAGSRKDTIRRYDSYLYLYDMLGNFLSSKKITTDSSYFPQPNFGILATKIVKADDGGFYFIGRCSPYPGLLIRKYNQSIVEEWTDINYFQSCG